METVNRNTSHFLSLYIGRALCVILIISSFLAITSIVLGKLFNSDLIAYIGPRPGTRWLDNRFAINLYDTRTQHHVPLTDQTIYPQVFRWSPDGAYIATIARPYGRVANASGLYIMRADGHDARLASDDLVVVITNEHPPYWTEDSQYVIFRGQQGANGISQFYRVSVAGHPPELLDLGHPQVQSYLESLFPTYYVAPNRLSLAYIDFDNLRWHIFLIENGVQRPIYTFLNDQLMSDGLDWSADSTHITFNLHWNRFPSVVIIAVNGGHFSVITQGRAPLWKPK